MIDFDELTKKFEEKLIKWRIDSTYAEKNGVPTKAWTVPYLDARDVAERLDDVVGQPQWNDQYEVIGNGSMQCFLTIYDEDFPNGKQTKAGIGGPGNSDNPAKAAESDSLKRAGLKWGIARYIYRSNRVRVKLKTSKGDNMIYGGKFANQNVYFEPPSINLEDNTQTVAKNKEKPSHSLVTSVLDLAKKLGDVSGSNYVEKVMGGVEQKFSESGLKNLPDDEAAESLKKVATKQYLTRVQKKLKDTLNEKKK